MTQQLTNYQQPSTQKPMDRLFIRMASIYAKHWLDMWAHLDIETVKAEWEKALSEKFKWHEGVAGIEYCASNMKFPPTLPEFMEICRSAKGANAPILPAISRKFSKEEMAANREKLRKACSVLTRAKP
jgi:hypothetical protein